MKVLVSSLLLILVLTVPGCTADDNSGISLAETSADTELFIPKTKQIAESSVSLSVTEESEPEDTTAFDVLEQYAELYNADYIFDDIYLPEKHLLIGDENIVQLISIGGYDKATVIKHDSVERVEHTVLDQFTRIEIFDKTNQSVSISVSPAEGTEILELLS